MPGIRNLSARPRPQRGVALIAVLTILAFLTVIVVGLTFSMKTESEAAHSYEANTVADLLASQGVAYVKASLKGALEEAGTNAWSTAPGAIVYVTNGTSRMTPLSSGMTVNTNASAGVYQAYDLNRAAVSQDQLRVITGTTGAADGMYAGWIYVHQSGLCDTNQAPALNPSDPVIGRFAYWTDDESSRVDLNTAWGGAGNTNPPNHPSRIGLSNLFGASLATMIYTNATNSAFLSPDDARRLDPGLAAAIATNRFSLTHSSFSPNLNPWGQPKIVLTTQASLTNGTGSTNYLNILTTPNTDPGVFSNISSNNLTATVSNLVALLSTNWPYFNSSFAKKYQPANSPYRMAQIAVDLIEYVRAVESTNAITEPLRGVNTGSHFSYMPSGSNGNTFFGNSRRPLLTQIGMTVSTTPNAAFQYEGQVMMTFYLPPQYVGASLNTNSITVGVQTSPANGACTLWPTSPGVVAAAKNLQIGQPETALIGTYPMTPGSSCVILVNIVYTGTIPNSAGFPLRAYFSNTTSGNPIWEISCINNINDDVLVPVTMVNAISTPSIGQSFSLAECRDPRASKFGTDWTNVTDKLGLPPTIWTTPFSMSPPQDTQIGGSVATNDLYMPPPKGQPGNVNGVVQSVAELGHIFTGGSTNGLPWRTIRLQPTPGTNNIPPDWTLLDLFQAPYQGTNNAALYQPQPGTIAGRINVNSGLFTNSVVLSANSNVSRFAPLVSLLEGTTNWNASALGAVTNIAAMNLAASGTNYGVPCYISPGEISEIAGVADGGEASETNLYGVVDLATTQGGVFRIYCVGQALKQTPFGQLIVQAEQYKEAIVRNYNSAWTNGSTTLLWKSIPQ